MDRLLCAVTLLLSLGITRADEATDLLDKAIKAQAKDATTLKKLTTHVCSAKGKGYLGADEADVMMVRQGTWPGAFRIAFVFTKESNKVEITLANRDDRGWQQNGTMVSDLNPEQVSELRLDVYGVWVSLLLSLKESGVKLSTVPGVKVAGENTLGLRATQRPWPEMTLYFDEKTLFLRKQVFRSPDGGVAKTKEFYYDDYKEFDGLMLPTKARTVVAGRELFNYDKIEYSFPTTIDKTLFEKPAPKK
jgi:hypothetical protein